MRKAIKSIFLITVLFVALLLALIFDLSPIVKPNASQQVDNADTVQPLLDQVRNSFRRRYQAQSIEVNSQQANSLAGFLQRAKEQVKADVSFDAQKITIQSSYQVSSVIVDLYLNLDIEIAQGKGVNITQFKVGKLTLPGSWAIATAEYMANTYTQSEVATKAIASVESVVVKPNLLTVNLAPLDGLLREFKNIKTGGSSKDTRLLKIKIAHYLRVLEQLYVPPPKHNERGVSLSYYLHAVMKEAFVMSKQSSATLENEAAIMAITIYAGSPRFVTLIGDLSFAIEHIPTARPKPVLVSRGDLSLHFIFSAAIKLMSQKGVSIAVGEFKELMDRGKGGSGYSFIDLAADMSGAHFAALAVDPKTAKHLQKVLMQAPNESLFMVSIEDLEEGMSKADFVAKYKEVDSLQYNTVVDIINERIQALPIKHSQ